MTTSDLLYSDLLDGESEPYPLLHALVHTSIVGSPSGTPLTLNPGDTLVATPDLKLWNTDRTGRCSLDNEQVFAPGQPPARLREPAPGTPEHDDAHEAAHKAAWALTDPDERRAAVDRVHEQFGYLGRSRTLRSTL